MGVIGRCHVDGVDLLVALVEHLAEIEIGTMDPGNRTRK
jgi:hypothetical protein